MVTFKTRQTFKKFFLVLHHFLAYYLKHYLKTYENCHFTTKPDSISVRQSCPSLPTSISNLRDYLVQSIIVSAEIYYTLNPWRITVFRSNSYFRWSNAANSTNTQIFSYAVDLVFSHYPPRSESKKTQSPTEMICKLNKCTMWTLFKAKNSAIFLPFSLLSLCSNPVW